MSLSHKRKFYFDIKEVYILFAKIFDSEYGTVYNNTRILYQSLYSYIIL